MIETNKNKRLRVVIGGMTCLFVSACWFVMNGEDKHTVNAGSENSGEFYYSTLSDITGEETQCVAWEVPGSIGTAYICVSKVVVDGMLYPAFSFQSGEFSGTSENPERESVEPYQRTVLLRTESMPTGTFFEAVGKAKSWQGDWITNNLAATQIVELLQSERLIVKQPRQENKTFVFDLSVPRAKGFADVGSDFLAVR